MVGQPLGQAHAQLRVHGRHAAETFPNAGRHGPGEGRQQLRARGGGAGRGVSACAVMEPEHITYKLREQRSTKQQSPLLPVVPCTGPP